jgi:hypothetical protein
MSNYEEMMARLEKTKTLPTLSDKDRVLLNLLMNTNVAAESEMKDLERIVNFQDPEIVDIKETHEAIREERAFRVQKGHAYATMLETCAKSGAF